MFSSFDMLCLTHKISDRLECIYAAYDQSKETLLLQPLAESFLLPSSLRSVEHVITYNYDNTLERCLSRLGGTYTSVYSSRTYGSKDEGLRIYHPHGFLPHPENDPEDHVAQEQTVLTERDYHGQYINIGHWSNVIQSHHFVSRCCLFIGLSLTDPNVRRILDYARGEVNSRVAQHIAIQRLGANPVWDALFEKELLSLGIHLLWVREYEDIPRVLRNCLIKRQGIR